MRDKGVTISVAYFAYSQTQKGREALDANCRGWRGPPSSSKSELAQPPVEIVPDHLMPTTPPLHQGFAWTEGQGFHDDITNS